jgi:hypothetical protein
MQHHFWPNPNQVASKTHKNGYKCVDQDVLYFSWIEKTLKHKNRDEKVANTSPGQIGFWPENFNIIHNSIFALPAANRVGL